MVEDEVVDALVTAVRSDYPRLAHRYYQMKAKWLGLPKLQHWDRNAPLPDDDDRHIDWPEARERVLTAYGAFSPELASVGRGSSTRHGSMRSCSRARRVALSRIPRCRARIPICC